MAILPPYIDVMLSCSASCVFTEYFRTFIVYGLGLFGMNVPIAVASVVTPIRKQTSESCAAFASK